MGIVPFNLPSGAFATPLPWQAEITFFMFAVLLFCLPHIMDSFRKFFQAGDEHDHDEDNQPGQI